MSDQTTGVLVTLDIVIPRLSPTGWEVVLQVVTSTQTMHPWKQPLAVKYRRKLVWISRCISFDKSIPFRILKIRAGNMYACSMFSQSH